MQAESKWLYPVRNFGRVIDLSGGNQPAKRAMILSATRSTVAGIPARYRAKCRLCLKMALDLDLFKPAPGRRRHRLPYPLRIAFVGRLLPFKGVAMLLAAIKALDFPVQLTIVGEGSERSALERMTDDFGIGEKSCLPGNLPLRRDRSGYPAGASCFACLRCVNPGRPCCWRPWR